MTKSPKNDSVGDEKSPPLRPDSAALRDAIDQTMTMIAEPALKLKVLSPTASMASVGMNKHSNVAKLYRCHRRDEVGSGLYRIYVPGVGTYFKDVHDDGGSALGRNTRYLCSGKYAR